MDSGLIEAFKYSLPVFTLVIGWMIKLWDDRNKASKDDKRKLKKALFYLLEVRHQLKKVVIEDIQFDTYIKLLKKNYGHIPDINNLDNNTLKQFLGPLLDKVIEKPFVDEKETQNLNGNYVKSIDNLSEVDPILAFRLYGKQHVIHLINEALTRYKSAISEVPQINVEDQQTVIGAINRVEPKFLEEAIFDIEGILLEIAKSINRKTFKETKKRIEEKMDPTEQKEMEDLFERLIKTYMDSILEKMQAQPSNKPDIF
jgi:hypothetical protein